MSAQTFIDAMRKRNVMTIPTSDYLSINPGFRSYPDMQTYGNYSFIYHDEIYMYHIFIQKDFRRHYLMKFWDLLRV